MITEYCNNIDKNIKDYWDTNNHLYSVESGLRDSAWGLVQTYDRVRSFRPADFKKVFSIRDL